MRARKVLAATAYALPSAATVAAAGHPIAGVWETGGEARGSKSKGGEVIRAGSQITGASQQASKGGEQERKDSGHLPFALPAPVGSRMR